MFEDEWVLYMEGGMEVTGDVLETLHRFQAASPTNGEKRSVKAVLMAGKPCYYR